MAKAILHIDLNYFFVRCEEIKNPDLEGKPVAIGHAGRAGVVSTCSYKAREYGVRSGMPVFKALQLCKDLILINGDYSYYEKKSKEFFKFLRSYSTIIEPASIDECYMDITSAIKNTKDVKKYLEVLQNKLFNKTKLKCSIGLANTKFLAKMGSDLKKPMGITIIRKKDIPTLIYPLPIEDFYGIGKKTAPKLRELGINTIGDLANRILPPEIDVDLLNQFGKFYTGIKQWLSGKGDDVVSTEEWDPKSISHSHTLTNDTNEYELIFEALQVASTEVSKHAKEAKKVGNTIQLIVKDNTFSSYVRSSKISYYTNEYIDILNVSLKLYEKHFMNNEDKLFRLIGVGLQNLENEGGGKKHQPSVFDDFDKDDDKLTTDKLVSQLNRKAKKSAFKTGSELLEEKLFNGNK